MQLILNNEPEKSTLKFATKKEIGMPKISDDW
jgi:hypothetical protein